jgi:polyphosphate kinase
LIAALYEASNAGVKIELVIRGVCCLVPKVPGLSENIRVVSIVGRYLEHSRVLYFYNNGNEEIYLSSADFMQRNLDRRVEIAWPVEDPKIKSEIIKSLLSVSVKDNVKGRELQPDMNYIRCNSADDDKKINSQEWLMDYAVRSSAGYSKTKPSTVR